MLRARALASWHRLGLPDLTIPLVKACSPLLRAQTLHFQTLRGDSHTVPVMHVLKANVTDVIRYQLPDFSGHFALQYAGELLVDLLPMKGHGLGCGAQASEVFEIRCICGADSE